MSNVAQAKRKLKHGNWSYRAAAEALGCAYQFLNKVLNGHETSAPLLAAIDALPTFDEWRRVHESGK